MNHSTSFSKPGGLPGTARQGGFTLLEMLVVLTIIGIFAAIAAPSMRGFIATQRCRSASTDMFMSLLKARSEALKRNTNVQVLPASGGWVNGWTIPDPTAGTTFAGTVVPAGTLIEGHSALSGITVTGPVSVTYQGSGRISAAVTVFTFTSGATANYCVSIDTGGRPYSYTC